MHLDPRQIAVATAGFCTFVNLYSPQALLPALAREFGVGRRRDQHHHDREHVRRSR